MPRKGTCAPLGGICIFNPREDDAIIDRENMIFRDLARASSHVIDFDTHNKLLTQKLLE